MRKLILLGGSAFVFAFGCVMDGTPGDSLPASAGSETGGDAKK